MLDLVRALTFSFSAIDSLLLLHFNLVRCELEYASSVWNNITATDANQLSSIQRKFAALCFTRFFPRIPYNNVSALELLNYIISMLEGFTWMLFFVHVFFSGSKVCPLIDNINIRVCSCSTRNLTQFYIARKENCPSSDVQHLQIWYAVEIEIYLESKLDL